MSHEQVNDRTAPDCVLGGLCRLLAQHYMDERGRALKFRTVYEPEHAKRIRRAAEARDMADAVLAKREVHEGAHLAAHQVPSGDDGLDDWVLAFENDPARKASRAKAEASRLQSDAINFANQWLTPARNRFGINVLSDDWPEIATKYGTEAEVLNARSAIDYWVARNSSLTITEADIDKAVTDYAILLDKVRDSGGTKPDDLDRLCESAQRLCALATRRGVVPAKYARRVAIDLDQLITDLGFRAETTKLPPEVADTHASRTDAEPEAPDETGLAANATEQPTAPRHEAAMHVEPTTNETFVHHPAPPSGIRTNRNLDAEVAAGQYLKKWGDEWRRGTRPPPVNKDAARAAVMAAYPLLSGRAFERAWAANAPAEWTRSGRKNKAYLREGADYRGRPEESSPA